MAYRLSPPRESLTGLRYSQGTKSAGDQEVGVLEIKNKFTSKIAVSGDDTMTHSIGPPLSETNIELLRTSLLGFVHHHKILVHRKEDGFERKDNSEVVFSSWQDR
eukprot:PhF_6_TR18435/c0_g3_i1/m.27024